jgi:hypothetical protein
LPLCQAHQTEVKALRRGYESGLQETDRKKLKTTRTAINGLIIACPEAIRPMLTEAVLVPVQQRRRKLPRPTNLEFPWEKTFSADAFDTTMKVAGDFPYTKSAKEVTLALKAYEKLKEKAVGQSSKDMVAKARVLLSALELVLLHLRAVRREEDYQEVNAIQAYVDWLEGQAAKDVEFYRGVVQGKDADCPPRTFVPWDKKNFEQVLDEAVKCGAIEDLGTKEFTEQMKRAQDKVKTWQDADAPDKTSRSKKAWNHWDKVARLAKGFQNHTQNGKLRSYFEGAIVAATKERDKFTAP